jgi:heme A synthase
VSRVAWGLLLFNLGVILWGAFVRATGSGAGCGAHWPTCNGEVVPRAAATETLIEFTHRATSGMALLGSVGLMVLALRTFSPGHRARRAAAANMVFMLLEAAVGAALVLLELTGNNDSLARAGVMGAHLVNTFLLVGSFVLVATWAGGTAAPQPGARGLWAVAAPAAVALLVVAASGGITALGDTLFPAGSLSEGLAQDFSPTAHLLVRLRVLHPVLAMGTALLVAVAAAVLAVARPVARPAAALVLGLVAAQVAFGWVNLLLLAPVWGQLLHLLGADLLWVAFVWAAARALGASAPAGARAPVPAVP